MLDEAEWTAVTKPWASLPAEDGAAHGASAGAQGLRARLASIVGEYHQVTGFPETNANAIMHHRISLYGPPCTVCGKPLRTPRASFCAACGVAAADGRA
jgi:hypothetical protein